jgi:hypothetical protein
VISFFLAMSKAKTFMSNRHFFEKNHIPGNHVAANQNKPLYFPKRANIGASTATGKSQIHSTVCMRKKFLFSLYYSLIKL